MPSPGSLRPIILPSARHLSPIPSGLLCCPLIHRHHHRRTTATLRSFTKSRNFASLVGSAVAATFGTALWLRPQRSTNAADTVPSDIIYALYGQIVEEFVMPNLHKAFTEYLGCQNIQFSQAITPSTATEDDPGKIADIQMALFLDADAASENFEGSVLGFGLTSTGAGQTELLARSREILIDWDKQGWLRREGKAVCLISCIGIDGIWVYGELEVEGVVEREWMIPIISMKKDYPCFLSWT